MSLHMEPGQTYSSWAEFKEALDTHCRANKVVFNISNAKTVEQANSLLKKKPYFDIGLKYASCILVCKHYGSYKSLSTGVRPKQRSYKINCKAFISVSACRKENYLIIRDSYHIHSHPCSEEIYNSYPEIRRMSKEERKMIGTLMELGVPISQIKSAVGRHVTPKDLQNAKTHIKAASLGLKSDGFRTVPKNKQTHKVTGTEQDTDEKEEKFAVLETNEEFKEKPVSNVGIEGRIEDQTRRDNGSSDTEESYTIMIGDSNDNHLEVGAETLTSEVRETTNGEMSGLSGLLAAAGINSDAVVLTVNSQTVGKNENDVGKSSYTVTVSLPAGELTNTSTNLQELLKGLPLDKFIGKSSTVTLPVSVKSEVKDQPTEIKPCSKCGGYVSPLDGHSQCLNCLGPEHIHQLDCEHCRAMTPEQFNIRRKKMVAMRMKALKELRHKHRIEDEQSDDNADSDFDLAVRKSKRQRKPKQFGPDMEVESSFILRNNNVEKTSKPGNDQTGSKMTLEDEKSFLALEPKKEILEEDSAMCINSKVDCKANSLNTKRFEHILSQTAIFEDVSLVSSNSKSHCYVPDVHTITEFQSVMGRPDVPPAPSAVLQKYNLDHRFESLFCSDVEPLTGVTNNGMEAMSSGLCKLARNAAVQTRVAVYDKLFTRLGVSMADEALSILSELYTKVTEVTEISQEDLTNSLQTALDTIQALKDVMEELGLMSQDALTSAAHQRSLSVNSLNAAKRLLKSHPVARLDAATRRSKFLPFSRTQLSHQTAPSSDQISQLVAANVSAVSEISQRSDQKNVVSSTASSVQLDTHISELPIVALASSHGVLEVNPDVSTTYINMSGKEFTMTPLTVSSELLQTLTTNKDGIIELHVLKDEADLLDQDHTTVEEIIHAI